MPTSCILLLVVLTGREVLLRVIAALEVVFFGIGVTISINDFHWYEGHCKWW